MALPKTLSEFGMRYNTPTYNMAWTRWLAIVAGKFSVSINAGM